MNVNRFLTPFLKHPVAFPVTCSIHGLKGDTIGQGYNQPADIVAYKGGRALLTTTSGYLLVLDVSRPQSPQITAPLRSNIYSAFRVAAAPEYTYKSSECGVQSSECQQNVIDLAVTSSMQGKINTVNVTDPYDPQVMGVAKDSDGHEVIITAWDIVISKASGLVYITAGNSVYIIDVKDPYNPKLLNIVTATPIEPGMTTTTELGYSPALVEKDGWVYLASQNQGMRVLDLDPEDLGIEQVDLDDRFKDVKLPAQNYYPALGTKALTVYGRISGGPFPENEHWQLRLPEGAPANLLIGGRLDSHGLPIPLGADSPCIGRATNLISCFSNKAGYDRSFTTMYIRWNGAGGTDLPDAVKIKLQAVKMAASGSPGKGEATEVREFAITFLHNGKITLQEVLDGTNVFVYDTDEKHKGAYDAINNRKDEEKQFYFVQELLNQVVPRMRAFRDASSNPIPNSYQLIEEDGIFGETTSTGLEQFKLNFLLAGKNSNGERTGNYTANFSVSPTGVVSYDKPDDDTTDTFRKLMKDYNHLGSVIGYADSDKDDASTSYFINYYLLLPPRSTFVFPQYGARYWAGIDCSGFIQRSVNSADKLHILGAKSGMFDLGTGSCDANAESCPACDEVGSQTFMPKYASRIYDSKATIKVRAKALSKVRKGDLVVYSRLQKARSACAFR